VVAVLFPHPNERYPELTVVEKATLVAPAVRVMFADGLTAFVAVASYVVAANSTDTSENGLAQLAPLVSQTVANIGMDVPPNVHVAELGTLIVALPLVT